MSRCFPFPPPGYEKKASYGDNDLLTKDKHKEKKHKKDKKDKEKKEDREKKEGKEKKHKDKEKSKDKHRDKKDRKEKHKEKKDKDKEKNGASDSKTIKGQTEHLNGDKLGLNSLQNNEIKSSKYVQELERRIRDEDRAMGSQIGPKIMVTDHRRAEMPGRMVERNTLNTLEEKEKARDKIEDDKRVNGQRNHIEARSSGNANFQGFSGADKKISQGTVKALEKNDFAKQTGGKEKKKRNEGDRNSKDDRHKDQDREKKSRSKDKERDKEKKQEEKAKEIGKPAKEQDKLKISSNLANRANDVMNSSSIRKPSHLLKTSSKSSAEEGSHGKRKEREINGVLHDNGIRPNKLARPVSSSHSAMENGRKLETCQTAIPVASHCPRQDNNHKVDVKEHRLNGLKEVPQPDVKSSRRSPTVCQYSENGEAAVPVKKPHPDSVYLEQILSLPKVEWSGLDDQEWLFNSESKEPKLGSSGFRGTQSVWAEAVQIEMADITALPYVIPY